jgi:hypothetical protein
VDENSSPSLPAIDIARAYQDGRFGGDPDILDEDLSARIAADELAFKERRTVSSETTAVSPEQMAKVLAEYQASHGALEIVGGRADRKFFQPANCFPPAEPSGDDPGEDPKVVAEEVAIRLSHQYETLQPSTEDMMLISREIHNPDVLQDLLKEL